MSVYRGNNRLFFNDVEDVTPSPASVEGHARRSDQAPPPKPPPADVGKLRKATPAPSLLPGSRRWLEQLPEEVRPNLLARDFPRIVNNLCAAWGRRTPCGCAPSSYL